MQQQYKYYYRIVYRSKKNKITGLFEEYLIEEFIKTVDITPFNYGKKVRFVQLDQIPDHLKDIDPNQIVEIWLSKRKKNAT